MYFLRDNIFKTILSSRGFTDKTNQFDFECPQQSLDPNTLQILLNDARRVEITHIPTELIRARSVTIAWVL